MDLLDQLFAEAAAEAKHAKKKLNGTAALAEVRESQYFAHRLIALYNASTCTKCESCETTFEGLFEEKKHHRVGDTHWIRLGDLPYNKTLPRVKLYNLSDRPYCELCAEVDSYKEIE